MNNIIEVTPDKNGKMFITLYGTKYQIVIKGVKDEEKPAEKKTK